MRYVWVSILVIDYHGLINQSKGGDFIGMFIVLFILLATLELCIIAR